MQLVCLVFDWAVTAAFLLYALVVIFVPRARLHPLIPATLVWGFLMYAGDYFFVQFGHTTIGGHDYSEYLTLLTPIFAFILLVGLAFMPIAVEFVIVTLMVMMICGWYNFDVTLSTAFTAAFIIIVVIGFLRLAYIMQVFLLAIVVSALISVSVFAMIVQWNLAHTDLTLDDVCDDHINMILVCDIRCGQILTDPNAFMHSFFVVLCIVLIVFRLLVVFRLASDIWDEEQLQSLCWCCRCCRCFKWSAPADRMVPPPTRWFTFPSADEQGKQDSKKVFSTKTKPKTKSNGHHSQYTRVDEPEDLELNLDEGDEEDLGLELELVDDNDDEPVVEDL